VKGRQTEGLSEIEDRKRSYRERGEKGKKKVMQTNQQEAALLVHGGPQKAHHIGSGGGKRVREN